MKICIFGMGYVGAVSGACLADMGHKVVGVDPNSAKVSMINEGKSPIVEEGIGELIGRVVKEGRFSATEDWREAVDRSDLAMVSVGTPSRSNGSIDLQYLRRVCEQIGGALKGKNSYYTVVIRSTVLPGSVEETVIPALQKSSGKRAGTDFGVCMNPEFLREGTSIEDFHNPPKTVVGQLDERSGDVVAEIYREIKGPVVRLGLRAAEMVKYVDNAFHALKVSFANEIGNICKSHDIDSHRVMEAFCLDTKLNLSPYYLKPGFAFGGSCLPKDLRAITYDAQSRDLPTPLLSSILASNQNQIHRVNHILDNYKGKCVGFMGLTFKGGTDDLRESPIVEVVEFALGKGFHVKVFDQNVAIARLMGGNKAFIEQQIPHISSLFVQSLEDLAKECDVIVIANKDCAFRDALTPLPDGKTVVDLVRIFDEIPESPNYHGICW